MFDLGSWGEIFIIAVVALILLGPKEIPVVLRALGRWIAKAKNLSNEVRSTLNHFIHQGEFEEFKKSANIYTPLQNDNDPLKKPIINDKKTIKTPKRRARS